MNEGPYFPQVRSEPPQQAGHQPVPVVPENRTPVIDNAVCQRLEALEKRLAEIDVNTSRAVSQLSYLVMLAVIFLVILLPSGVGIVIR